METNYFEKPIRKRFIDAFPKEEDFLKVWKESPFNEASITDEDIHDIYNHLLARYYNWHYIYPDNLGINMNTMHVIHDYYPNVKERLNLVKQMRDLPIEEFKKSGVHIASSGANPKIQTQMDELIDLVDTQDASFELKSIEQALKQKFFVLYDGVMDEFIDRFKDMFVVLYNGVTDYIYKNNCEEE